jgi:hypothetical protein
VVAEVKAELEEQEVIVLLGTVKRLAVVQVLKVRLL